MPQAQSTTHVLAEKKLIIYRRERSNVWQCRYKVGNRWKRETTKETDRKQAEKKAWDLMAEADFRLRNNLPAITRRFRDVAALAVKRMETELKNNAGKVIYADYQTAIRDYLTPFFGKHSVDKIDYAVLDQFDVWRTEKMGRVPSKSTVHTHNAALSRIFDEAVLRGFLAEIEKPKLDVTGRKTERRPSFDDEEVVAMVNGFEAWAAEGLTEASREKRGLLKDYVMMLLDTGARAGKELMKLKWNQIKTEINPEFTETGKFEANEWGEAEEVVNFNLNRIVWMPVNGKTGPRTILAFDRFYSALDHIAQRNYGKTLDQVLALKLDEYVIRTKAKEEPKKFPEMFKSYLKQSGLLVDPKTSKSRCLYCLRHTYATLLMEKDAVDVFLLALQMGSSVEMIKKHYGHVNILKAADHLKAGRARQLFRGVGLMNTIYKNKLAG